MIKKSNLIKFGSAILTSLFIASCDGGSDSDSDREAPFIRTDMTIEASGPIGFSGGFFVSHSGSFDFFDIGEAASDPVTEFAETGNPLSLVDTLASGVPGDTELIFSTIRPGTSSTQTLDISEVNRYLTFVSQVFPSSDTFIGNDDPLEFDIYQMLEDSPDGTVTIEITELYDAGTEVNDFLTSNGNEFIAGLPEGDPEAGEDENGVITLHTPTFYNEYLNPGDFDVSTLNPNGAVVARITFTIAEQ